MENKIMKYLLLFLLSFNVYAADCIIDKPCKAEILPFGNVATKDSKQEAEAWVEDNQKLLHRKKHRSSFGLEPRWLEVDHGNSDAQKDIFFEDLEGNMQSRTEYHYPANYTVDYHDMSQELGDIAEAEETDRLERVDLKSEATLLKINNSNLAPWHKKLHRRQIKAMRAGE
jgi:hypothetical protein